MPNPSDDEDEIDRIARNPHPQRLPKNNDDSSSSRESSPDGRNRSFTPISDDGDMQVPPIPDDDTPPPPDKPVIRQALAFDGSTTSANLNTYSAKPATGNAIFLPGQTVAPPPPKPKKPKAKTKKEKKKDPYGTQTGRFRLADWSTPSVASTPQAPVASYQPTHDVRHIDVGNAYPLYSMPPQPPPSLPAVSHSSQSLSYLSSTQYVPPTFAPIPPAPAPVYGGFPTTQTNIPIASSSKGKAPEKSRPLPSKSATKTAKQKVKPSRNNTVDTVEDRPSSTYYRRDYQNQVDIDYDTMSNGSGGGPSSSHIPDHLPKHKSDHVSIKQTKASRPLSRMVTVLLTDIRSGVEDHQLAEVVVPLKEADAEHPEYGFWANAQEVVAKLQSTPSRIEGPARVYTMRGKYRQFFLRVHDDGIDEVQPTNISVSAERTLEVVVETAPQPGELPAPPRIPRDLQPSPEPDDVSSNSPYNEPPRDKKSGRKRYRSTSAKSTGDYDGSYSIPSPGRRSPSSSSYQSSKKKKKEVDDSDAELFINELSRMGQEWPYKYDSPTSDGDEDLEEIVADRIDPHLQIHPLWSKIYKTKAKMPCVPAYVALYSALEQLFTQYEGRRAPFRSNRNIRIRKVHILKALNVLKDDEFSDLADPDKVSANCSETLRLLSLYGPEGTRLKDLRVQEMLEDNNKPTDPHIKPQKRFLRLLRDIDEKWKEGHPADEEADAERETRPLPEETSIIESKDGDSTTTSTTVQVE